MPASRNKRKRSEIDQGKVPSATARRGSSKSSSGNELKRAKNEAKNETEPVAAIDQSAQVAEPLVKSTISQDKADQNEARTRDNAMTGTAESSENIPPAQPSSGTALNDNNSQERQIHEIQSINENSKISEGLRDSISNSGHSREWRIISAITHRKLLLKRIRQCERAANERLSSMIQLEKDQKEASAVSRESNSAEGLGTIQTHMQDTDEVEYFRELSRLASQAAKQKRSEGGEGPGENRASVSLRRGAAVGKRMNAALSTLAPGGNPVTASVDPAPAASTVATGNPQVPLASTSIVPKAISSQNLQATAQPQGSTSRSLQQPQPQQPPPLQQPQQPQAQLQPHPQQHMQQQVSTTIGKAVQSQPKEKTKRSTVPKQPKLTLSTTLSDQYAPAALPLHQRAGGSTLPPNRLAQPKVVCPETKALREKRGALRLKLAALLASKSKPSKESGQYRHASQQKQFQNFSSFESQKSSQEDQFSWDTTERDIYAPLRLPKRRKSHWDYVLEEMRWMATDFVEERKWKHSTARLMASAVISGAGSNPTSHTSVPQAITDEPLIMDIAETAVPCRASGDTESEPYSQVNGTRHSDSSSLPAPELGQHSRLRRYEPPSSVESKTSRGVARILSSMPKLLSAALVESGTLPASDSSFVNALQNWQQILTKEASEQGGVDSAEIAQWTKSQENGISKKSSSSRISKPVSEPTLIETTEKETSDLVEASNVNSRDQLAKYVDYLCSQAKAFVGAPPKRSKQTRLHESLSFTPEQEEAIQFADYIWSAIDAAGVVLGGPAYSGKTTVSCSLLSRHRDGGPQLLICSPASVIRWEFELSRFGGLNAINQGFDEGISCHLAAVDSVSNFKEGDVVVCEFSFLGNSKMPDLSIFNGIVIDCRRPIGFVGSIDGTDLQQEFDGTSESASVAWWESLLDKLPSRNVRRMLVDGASPELCQTKTPSPRTPADLELLALRTSFVLGPKTYAGVRSSRARNIVAWAKHAARASPELGDNKTERVRAVLVRAFSSFSYCFKSSPMSEPKAFSTWELRQCAIHNSQRLAYNLTCREVRGILSKALEERMTSYDGGDQLDEIMNCLLRLRRVCSHANLAGILSDSAVDPQFSHGPLGKDQGADEDISSLFCRRIRESASQPDLERAFRILLGSGKIRELASILKNDCGCQIAGDEVLSSLIPGKDSRKGPTQRKSKSSQLVKRRIVILAELPDVQLLVSLFLSAVGLQHDLLLREGVKNATTASARIDDAGRVALAWIEHQLCLFRFNSGDKASCAIVVGSPSSLGADHCGLGVESADLVISMDEDWSGRCQVVMRSIVAQSLVWNQTQQNSTVCTFIRLVSHDTCEDLFLSALKCLEGELSRFLLTTDDFGIVIDIRTRALKEDGVANRFWNFRGQDLSRILCLHDELPTAFGSRSTRLFLPMGALKNTADEELESEKERLLIRHILRRSRRLVGSYLSLASNGEDINCANQMENPVPFLLVLPPSPSRFPQHAATRGDRRLLASRVYLERCAKLASWKHIAAEATSESSVSPDTAMWDRFGIDTGNVDGSELTDSWQKSCVSGRPSDSAASFLMYASAVSASEEASMQTVFTPSKAKLSSMEQRRSDKVRPPRINSFVGSFSVASIDTTMRDGNQGCEAAVYFPPIFPSLVLFTSQANFDAPRLLRMFSEESKSTVISSFERDDLKRKQPETSSVAVLPNSKRLKAQNVFSDTWDVGGVAGAGLLPLAEHLIVQTSPPSPRAMHKSQTPHKAVAPPPTIFTTRGQMNFPERPSRDHTAAEDIDVEYLRSLNEDFGLAGIGLLPSVSQSTAAAGMVFVESSTPGQVSEHTGDYEVNLDSIPCDAEEAEKTGCATGISTPLNTMILFVVKPKPRMPAGTAVQSFRSGQNMSGEMPWAAMPNNLPPMSYAGGSNGTIGDINGGTKKTKKKAPGPLPPLGPSAFSRLPAPDISEKMRPTVMPAAVSAANKDLYRNRMMLSPQVAQLLGKLFDVPSFRLASVRVRNRISDRASRLDRSSTERGHGLPTLELGNQHSSMKRDHSSLSSLARKLRNPKSQTGDEARTLSIQQKAALRRSLVSPCRVDFGPFQSGFLAAPTGTTGISPPRSRIGVSLPMGVKVPQAIRELNVPPWSAAEDRKLQVCAVRFGLNWVLASRSLTGLEDILVSTRRRDPPDEVASFPRSARHCRDRWQTLVKSQASLAKDVRKSEKVMRERAVMAGKDIPQVSQSVVRIQANEDDGKTNEVRNVAILVPTSVLDKQEDGPTAMEIDTETSDSAGDVKSQQPDGRPSAPAKDGQPRRSFAACRGARSKKVVIPLATLTSGTGSGVVASHQSHMQAVQAALATSTTSSGRTELWPLQILELADKHRAAAARAVAETAVSSSTAGRPSSSHSHRSATNSTTHGSGGANNGRGLPFPQVPLPAPQRSSSTKSSTISQPERLVVPSAGSPSRSPRKTVVSLPAQALPPPPMPPPQQQQAPPPALVPSVPPPPQAQPALQPKPQPAPQSQPAPQPQTQPALPSPPPPQQHPPKPPPASNPPTVPNPPPASTAHGEEPPPNPL